MIDQHEKGWVSVPELRESLEDLSLYPKKDDVFLFIRRFDKDDDGNLLFSDFCEAISPKDALSSSVLGRRNAVYRHSICIRQDYFSKATRELFLRTVRTHFSIE